MQNNYYMIQMTDTDAAKMLQKMARNDLRSYGNQVAYLIRQEYARRTPINTENTSAAVDEKQFAAKTQADCPQTAK